MKFYSARIRLRGPLNEVRREKLSAPEILILREIHGHDAVLGIRLVGEFVTDHQMELDRLRHTYISFQDAGRPVVDRMFGQFQPLPTKVSGVDENAEPEIVRPILPPKSDAAGIADLTA